MSGRMSASLPPSEDFRRLHDYSREERGNRRLEDFLRDFLRPEKLRRVEWSNDEEEASLGSVDCWALLESGGMYHIEEKRRRSDIALERGVLLEYLSSTLTERRGWVWELCDSSDYLIYTFPTMDADAWPSYWVGRAWKRWWKTWLDWGKHKRYGFWINIPSYPSYTRTGEEYRSKNLIVPRDALWRASIEAGAQVCETCWRLVGPQRWLCDRCGRLGCCGPFVCRACES